MKRSRGVEVDEDDPIVGEIGVVIEVVGAKDVEVEEI